MIRRTLAAMILFGATTALAQGHDHHGKAAPPPAASSAPTQPGQAAFAAIQEIVQILEADPRTDWSKVDIEALRRHLVDMDNVTLRAAVVATPLDTGVRYAVTGDGAVRDSIRRMVSAHAAAMNGAGGWTYVAAETADGATLTVTVPPADLARLRALGFIGVMTRGMHHQQHHLALARGDQPHH